MPDQEAPESLLLSYNSLAEAAIKHFAECCVGGMTQKQILMQLQSVCATYACQGVKRNAGLTDSKKKQQAATNAYKTLVVPGFLAWIKNLQGEPLKLPRWVDEHIMGCSNVNGKGRGEPKLYNDVNKVWTKHTNDYCTIRRDIIPIYDKVVASQPSGVPPSGQQYYDQLSELLDELWVCHCRQQGKEREAVDVEKEDEILAPRSSPSASPENGEKKSPSDGGSEKGADPTAEDASVQPVSREKSAAEGAAASGGAAGAGSAGELGPEPDEGSPDYPRWLARKAAMNNAAADAGGQSGDSTSSGGRSLYPDRPSNWMHPLTLTFCLFGRPAGKDEDTELSTCNDSSGPPKRGRKKKASSTPSKGGSSSAGNSDEGSSPENPLHPGAVRQFVGAGEAQSRAKVKKDTQALQQKESHANARAQFLQQAVEQTQLSRQVAAAVERTSADISAQRALDEEEACRKRKKQALEDLEGERQYCEPEEEAGLKAKIRALHRKPVSEFTAAYAAGGSSAPPFTAATPVVAALPGFSHDYNGTPRTAGGGGATTASGMAACSVGAPTAVTRI
eukprot:jgi/Undpi1/7857/HiC_scaffold_23.g10329.m1